MKNDKVFYNEKRELKYVPEWPEEPECKKHCDYTGICESIASPNTDCLCRIYKQKVEQAISKAIDFKLKEDEEKVKFDTWLKFPHEFMPEYKDWQPEVNKPYDVPEDLRIEVKEENCKFIHSFRDGCSGKKYGEDCTEKQFAFIKKEVQQPKEQDTYNCSQCGTPLIKKENCTPENPNGEGMFCHLCWSENWSILFQMIREGKYDLVKSKFKISRI